MDISEPFKKSELEVTNHGELFKQQAQDYTQFVGGNSIANSILTLLVEYSIGTSIFALFF
ncbi:MAG: hypothetical protein WCF23_04890 [Candidatus Nitrosopolaris sp.]